MRPDGRTDRQTAGKRDETNGLFCLVIQESSTVAAYGRSATKQDIASYEKRKARSGRLKESCGRRAEPGIAG